MMATTLIGWTGLSSPGQDLPLPEPGWDYFISGRSAAGYKDNVTLAHVAPQASPYLDTGLEVIVLRPPPLPTQFTLFGAFEDHRFFSGKVEKEQIGFAIAEVTQVFGGGQWQAGVNLEYLYQDQFLDVSVTETNLAAVRVQGHDSIVRPKVRRELGPSAWVEAQGPVQRQLLRAPLDNYWEVGPKFILGMSHGKRSEVTLSYEADFRIYDHEEQFSDEGDAQPGTHRRTWYHRVQWTWRHDWDQARHWRATTRLTYKFSNDSGAGYFNYTSVGASQEVRYRAKTWEASGEIKLLHYAYPVQTVSETDLRHRKRDELLVNFRLEKQLVRHLKVFTQFEREQIFSNLELDQFTVNTVTGGFLWEF